MKTLRKLLYGEVVTAVALVTLAFIALFFSLTWWKNSSRSLGWAQVVTKCRRH